MGVEDVEPLERTEFRGEIGVGLPGGLVVASPFHEVLELVVVDSGVEDFPTNHSSAFSTMTGAVARRRCLGSGCGARAAKGRHGTPAVTSWRQAI